MYRFALDLIIPCLARAQRVCTARRSSSEDASEKLECVFGALPPPRNRRSSKAISAIMTAPAAAELKATGAVKPRRYDDVAVLYCDVVGFTAYCDAHDPGLVVAHLQHLVEAFERLSAAAGLEKLKTVGDALIATAGLLESHPSPVTAALECGLAAIIAARDGPAHWLLRCGLHVGPVVGGVVGKSKFSFDIWGDTINTAARLAGVERAGAVHLSEAAWRHLASRKDCERVGPIALRGKGYVLVHRCFPH
jgi:adenylate cyclase